MREQRNVARGIEAFHRCRRSGLDRPKRRDSTRWRAAAKACARRPLRDDTALLKQRSHRRRSGRLLRRNARRRGSECSVASRSRSINRRISIAPHFVQRRHRFVHQKQSWRREQCARARPTRCRSPPDRVAWPAIEQSADAEGLDDRRRIHRSRSPSLRTIGQTRGSGALTDAERAAHPETRQRCAAGARARMSSLLCRPAHRRLSPRSRHPAFVKPARMSMIVLLPAPDGPNSAATRAPVSKAGVERENTLRESFRAKADHRIIAARPAALQPFRQSQRPHGNGRRHGCELQRGCVAARRLHMRPDRCRDRARLAGNVRHEGDRRAELAERFRKTEQHADKNTGQVRAAA